MPSEFGFEPRSPRHGLLLVLGLFDTAAHIRPFLAIFGPFLGHIVELEGKKELFVMGQSRRTWSVATVSLRLVVFTRFRDCFGPKKAVLRHKMRNFGRAPPDLAPPLRGATGEFLAQKLGFRKATT